MTWRTAVGKKTPDEMAPAAIFSKLFFDRLCEIGPPAIREVRRYLSSMLWNHAGQYFENDIITQGPMLVGMIAYIVNVG